MTLSCLKSLLLCALYTNLSHLTTTNMYLYVLFCVFPVCYDVRLSHLNKDYLLAYLMIELSAWRSPRMSVMRVIVIHPFTNFDVRMPSRSEDMGVIFGYGFNW